MPLDEYRRKRDFTRSPEPPGAVKPAARSGPRFFCVQKHLASHLHYDFRIEHGGVLLSWAVPKGPAIDPTVKRLAMHVEDHPLEYGTFEGVIPDGYGAGIVMLWDEGTWEPLVDDVDASLKKGDLKFKLHGVKLKGSWALVRTKGGDGRSWLLLKHRDEWGGPLDITEFAPFSVKSGGDFADILADEQADVWTSNRPAQGGQTGALLREVVAQAAALRAAREAESARSSAKKPAAGKTPAPKKKAAAKKVPAKKAPAKKAPAKKASAAKKR